MRDYSPGELLFRLVCFMVLSSVESFNWTAQPTNPTPVIKGQDVSLAWQYSFTAEELLQSQTQFLIYWKKLNQSTSDYDEIAATTYLKHGGGFFYREPQNPRIVVDKSDQATLHIKDVRREDEGTYKIEFTLKTDGSILAELRLNLTVLELPELAYVSNDQDVCKDSMVTLYCNATGKPAPNINWTRVWENGTDSEPLPVVDGSYVMSNINRSSRGTYRCTAYNGVGNPVNHTVKVIVRYSAPVVGVVKSSNIVIEGDNFSLTCKESGDPRPNVTWITVSNNDHSYGNILNFTNITRDDSGDYRCETKNRCGKQSRNESINVFYPPTDTFKNRTLVVSEGERASVYCPVLGNPHPNITWYKGNDTSPDTMVNATNILTFPKTKLDDDGWYTCFAENFLNNVTVTVRLLVEKPVPSIPSTSSKPTTKVAESTISARAAINRSCEERLIVQERFPSVACERCRHLGCFSAKAVGSRCGSVIIDFEMKFNQSAVVSEVLNVLKTAAKEDNLDGFKVDPNSIEQISTPPTGTSSTKKPVCNGFFKKDDCSLNLVSVIIIAVAGLIVICIIVGIIACWVHKRRKCRKDTRVHHSTSEERPFSRENSTPGDDNSYSRVNNGYAEAGPQSSEMTAMTKQQEASGPATVPDYAVVDKSAKKGKKKDKKLEEQKLAAELPQYAAVDKSKKKKKGEPDATYAEVDMSKKSKKKPKPGEVLYADLGDFHQMQELPAVSTSPRALPPIKKPTPYGETQYADITQFLKGDATLPESNNSQGPGTGTQAAPAPSNSQEPGTSTKEEIQAGNPGGDGGPGHETNF